MKCWIVVLQWCLQVKGSLWRHITNEVCHFMNKDYHSLFTVAQRSSSPPWTPPRTVQHNIYEAEDLSLRAFANPSSSAHSAPRSATQVDLVLPPASAFTQPGWTFHLILHSYSYLVQVRHNWYGCHCLVSVRLNGLMFSNSSSDQASCGKSGNLWKHSTITLWMKYGVCEPWVKQHLTKTVIRQARSLPFGLFTNTLDRNGGHFQMNLYVFIYVHLFVSLLL